jgi:gliding motility-associated-like protein
MNSPDNFKEILNRKFRDFKEPPFENDWELFKKKFDLKRSRNLLYRRLYYISAIVAVSIIATIVMMHRNNSQSMIPIQSLPNNEKQEKVPEPKSGKLEQQVKDTSLINNSSKESQETKPQSVKRKGLEISETPSLQKNKAGKQHADTGQIVSAKVLNEEKQLKTPLETQTEKQNINLNENPLKQTSEDNLNENLKNKIEPVDDVFEKTDSLSVNNNLNQSEKSGLLSPINKGENTIPEIVNVITPNGDGINDKLVIKNIERFAPCKLNIYNSAGENIYFSSNYQNNWDGTYKGKFLPEGTYYYGLETKDGKLFKGAVNILK